MRYFSRDPWYAGGLAFECIQCGRCCAGPEEGYVWATAAEIESLADYLKLSVDEMRRRFVRRVGRRHSIIEDPVSRDCAFLASDEHGRRFCRVYPVRPAQCRTWPFWPRNISDPDSWGQAGLRCPGINRGPLHGYDEIQRRRDETNP